MPPTQPRADRLNRLLASLALSILPISSATITLADSSIRVVGCNPSSIASSLGNRGLNLVIPTEDSAAEDQNDNADVMADVPGDEQLPRIAGSIPKPRGVSEDNSKVLTPLATVTRDQAVASAMAAIAAPEQRMVRKAQVEGENGFLVWAVKTQINTGFSSPDPRVEVKVDAGGPGSVLAIECDPEDN